MPSWVTSWLEGEMFDISEFQLLLEEPVTYKDNEWQQQLLWEEEGMALFQPRKTLL